MVICIDAAIRGAIKEHLNKHAPRLEADVVSGRPSQTFLASCLNLHLIGLKENLNLRGFSREVALPSGDGPSLVRRGPLVVELHFLVTAHSSDQGHEYELLNAALVALLKVESLLDEGMEKRGVESVTLEVAKGGDALTPALWTALDCPMRPAIFVLANVVFNPFEPLPVRRVRELVLASRQSMNGSGTEASLRIRRISAAGAVVAMGTQNPVPEAVVEVADGTRSTVADGQGFFHFEGLATGKVLMRAKHPSFKTAEFEVVVPPPGRIDLIQPVLVEMEKSGVEGWSGQLPTREGKPLSYVPVRVGTLIATSDGEGRFSLSRRLEPHEKIEVSLPGRGWVLLEELSAEGDKRTIDKA
jgi:hypothetical protein